MPTRPPPSLRVLHFDLDPRNAELINHAVQHADPSASYLHVDSAGAFEGALEEFAPDVILADHGVPGFSSLEALRLVQTRRPESPFFIVAGRFEQATSDCLKAGAADFVRSDDLSRLVPVMTAAIKQREPLRMLSERQRQVLRMLASGVPMREIATQLRVSIKTVETHRAAAMKRLGIRHLAGLVRYAIRVGIVSAFE